MKTILRVVLSFVLAAMFISAAYAQPPPTLLWSDLVDTNDITVSADGQYVVVATNGGVRFYGRSSSTPLWTYSQSSTYYTSVAISADGSYVAAGSFDPNSADGRVLFWADAKSLTGTDPTETWSSVNLGGSIDHRSLSISADGNYVAACGTGSNVFYWAGATGKSGYDIDTTWDAYLADRVEAITISDDGNHVAAAGVNYVNGGVGVLGYWNNAISLTGHGLVAHPTWRGQVEDEAFVDVAISNDGNYVVVAGAGEAGPSTVYYWASAATRSGTSEPYTWEGGVDVIFSSVDMSCDGDSVIAGARIYPPENNGPPTGSVYFWDGATHLSGNPAPSWTYPTLTAVDDVAINDAGTYMAAVDYEIPDTLYFFDRQGKLLWQDVEISGAMLSISCDGRTLAVGHYPFTTAYLLDTGYWSPCCGVEKAVGGAAMPVNTLAVLGPWLAVIGLVGCIGTVVLVAKKRRQ